MSEAKPTLIIKPTIGRRVWFRCNDSFAKEKGIYRIDDVQAMDAGIVYVHGDSMVNLIVTDHIGNTHAINSVALVDASDGNSHAMWCEWMPYQKEQAKSKCAVIEPATEQQIEQEIQSKNLNAPRLTPDHIDSKIALEMYFTGSGIIDAQTHGHHLGLVRFQHHDGEDLHKPMETLTFCVLVLENGFTVTGESACASPENFDAEIGRKIAFENARNKIWLLEGYLLKENLHKQNSKVELQAGIDQLLNTRIPILDQIYDLCQAIEKCGASPELTNAVRLAGELRYPISKLVDQALKLGIGEGIVSVSYSDNGSNLTPDLPEFKHDDVKATEPLCSTQACTIGSTGSNEYQLNAKRDNAFLVAQLLSNNKISAELRKKAETKMTALLDELI